MQFLSSLRFHELETTQNVCCKYDMIFLRFPQELEATDLEPVSKLSGASQHFCELETIAFRPFDHANHIT